MTGDAAALGIQRAQRRRALAVSTGVGLAGLALGTFQRHLPVGPLVLLGAGLALALVADRLTEASAEVGLQLALVAICVDIGWIAAVRAPQSPWTSPLLFLGPLPFFALLVGTRRTVLITAASGLATLGLCILRVDFVGAHVRASLTNFALAIVGGAALALVQEAHASQLQRGSMNLAASRARDLAELRDLDRVIFSDFMRPLAAISTALAGAAALSPSCARCWSRICSTAWRFSTSVGCAQRVSASLFPGDPTLS